MFAAVGVAVITHRKQRTHDLLLRRLRKCARKFQRHLHTGLRAYCYRFEPLCIRDPFEDSPSVSASYRGGVRPLNGPSHREPRRADNDRNLDSSHYKGGSFSAALLRGQGPAVAKQWVSYEHNIRAICLSPNAINLVRVSVWHIVGPPFFWPGGHA